MKTKDKAALKAHLEEAMEELARHLPRLKEETRPIAPDDALGRLTRLDAMQSLEINQNTYRQAQSQLAGFKYALSRIDQPDFGLCEECDIPIPLGRLKAVPGASHCVNCA